MKPIIYILILLYSIRCFSQDYSYYYEGKQIICTLNTKSVFVASHSINNTKDISTTLGSEFKIGRVGVDHSNRLVTSAGNSKSQNTDLFWVEAILTDSTMPDTQYLDLINRLKMTSGIDYVAPALYTDKNEPRLLSHLFFVQLISETDTDKVKMVASQTRTTILGREYYMPDWYILCAGNSALGNGIEMAKYFYETGMFRNTEPDLMGGVKSTTTCTVTDPLFTDQWNLNNTGQQSSDQTGYDIHACDAWTITTGTPNTIIGLIDNGPSLLHPDLAPNIINSWDAESESAPCMQYTDVDVDHGTATAGILIAQQNSIGISGVAPNCSLMPISIDLALSTASDASFAAAITHGYQNGASVLSNSWNDDNTTPQIDEAINNALNLGGRSINGGLDHLGSVVVFAAGNDDRNGIGNPASSNSDILTVGATSICPERKRAHGTRLDHFTSCDDGEWWWGSNYGTGLDIMAPGIRITTTDNQSDASTPGNYMNNFNGTSSACPQVAGVAALILSLYPCLKQEQVTAMIEQSANKINTAKYNYQPTTGEPNGTWNNEMGYGFLDAYASLNQIVNFSYLQHDDVTDLEKRYSLNFIQAGYNVTSTLTPGDFTIDNTANVDIKAQQYIEFEPGFKTVPGAVMLAHIDQFTGDCTNWVPKFDRKPPTDQNGPTLDSNSVKTLNADNIIDGISMFPNPFKNSFTVNFDVLTDGETTSVKVYDLTGRQLYQQSGAESLGLHSFTIPVNAAASLYIVEACMGGNCVTQKMIKYEED